MRPKPKTQQDKKRREPKPVRKPTAQYLENSAVYYLQRFSATTTTLMRVLMRKVHKAAHAYPDFDAAPFTDIIDTLVKKFVRLGYVNDEAYAEQKILSLRRKGASARVIENKLREKGLKTKIESNEDDELTAALRHIKRKRLGPYRTRTIENAAQKDLAAMARAGFSGAIARKALKQSID